MKLIEDEVIVLSTRPLKENDLWVHLLGRRLGRRTAAAKGARNSRKRFGGALDPFVLGWAQIESRFPERSDRLISLEAADAHLSIREDLPRLLLAGYACELVERLWPPGEEGDAPFDLLRSFLRRIARKPATTEDRVLFELSWLALLGFGSEEEALPGPLSDWLAGPGDPDDAPGLSPQECRLALRFTRRRLEEILDRPLGSAAWLSQEL